MHYVLKPSTLTDKPCRITKEMQSLALPGVAQWLSADLWVAGSVPGQGTCPVTGLVVGQAPSRGHMRVNHTLMFLYHSFSVPFPL